MAAAIASMLMKALLPGRVGLLVVNQTAVTLSPWELTSAATNHAGSAVVALGERTAAASSMCWSSQTASRWRWMDDSESVWTWRQSLTGSGLVAGAAGEVVGGGVVAHPVRASRAVRVSASCRFMSLGYWLLGGCR